MKPVHLFLLLLAIPFFGTTQQLTIEIKTGKYPYSGSPITFETNSPILPNAFYELKNIKTGKIIPAQPIDSNRLVVILESHLPAETTVQYLLQKTKKSQRSSGISFTKTKEGIQVKAKNKPLLFYHTAEVMPPADSPAYYQRSGFIHPVYSPEGKILTDDFPAGHAHQHALFMAWTSTSFRNTSVDFWNQQSKKGTVKFSELLGITKGPVFTEIRTKHKYVSVTHGEVLDEIWTIKIYPFNDYFLFDIESKQHNITADTLYLNKYHYGGMALRGSREWNEDDTAHFTNKWKLLTSKGLDVTNANATHAEWVDVSGLVENLPGGITVFDHPSNFRYPQALRVHPVMPYWAYSPMVENGFTIDPGKWYTSRYRYFVHSGFAEKTLIKKLFNDWSAQPEIKIVRK